MNRQSQWITFIRKTALNKTGTFLAKDCQGVPIIFEWAQTEIQSPDLAAFKKSICEIASQVLAPAEVQFLRAHPDSVYQEMFLKPCAPFFEKGFPSVDWVEVEKKIQSTIKQFYLTDLSAFGAEVIEPLLDDIYFYATVKNQGSKQLLGFIMFSITPRLEFGNIKIINLALMPAEQNRGIEQLLLSSIFRIVPEVKRLFLFIRPTNAREINLYQNCGFIRAVHATQDPNHKVNMENVIFLEYKTELSAVLQKTAKSLIDEKKRLCNHSPLAIAQWGWKYHHLGIPYEEPRPGETHHQHLKVFVMGFETSPYGIEWMRFEPDCPVPDILRKVPHIAFEVDDLDQALMGKEILLDPGEPSSGIRTAMIIYEGALIELIEFQSF